jgi:hypothetical protein
MDASLGFTSPPYRERIDVGADSTLSRSPEQKREAKSKGTRPLAQAFGSQAIAFPSFSFAISSPLKPKEASTASVC